MVSYLSKFLPCISDETSTLRQLDKKDVPYIWEEKHQAAFERIKTLISEAPTLHYYDPEKELTLQCDASKGGLGAVITQEGAPIAYASRALTPTEENYA